MGLVNSRPARRDTSRSRPTPRRHRNACVCKTCPSGSGVAIVRRGARRFAGEGSLRRLADRFAGEVGPWGRMLERLNSLWVGGALGAIERLSVVSALSVGHPFTILFVCAGEARRRAQRRGSSRRQRSRALQISREPPSRNGRIRFLPLRPARQGTWAFGSISTSSFSSRSILWMNMSLAGKTKNRSTARFWGFLEAATCFATCATSRS